MNLFGWNSKGQKESSRLVLLMCWDRKFKVLFKQKSLVCLQAPFQFQYKWLTISDNGGEFNVEWVNQPETMVSIPSTAWHSNLNAETMYYRICCVLEGQPIDYEQRCEAIDFKDLAAA